MFNFFFNLCNHVHKCSFDKKIFGIRQDLGIDRKHCYFYDMKIFAFRQHTGDFWQFNALKK